MATAESFHLFVLLLLLKKNKKRKADALELDVVMADEIKHSRKAMQSFNVERLHEKVDEMEDLLQEAIDVKDDLMEGGHYSEAVMRRCNRKIVTCRKRHEEWLSAYEEQKEQMKDA